jgi:hypothetical protein
MQRDFVRLALWVLVKRRNSAIGLRRQASRSKLAAAGSGEMDFWCGRADVIGI